MKQLLLEQLVHRLRQFHYRRLPIPGNRIERVVQVLELLGFEEAREKVLAVLRCHVVPGNVEREDGLVVAKELPEKLLTS